MNRLYKKVLIIDDDDISNYISQKLIEQCNVADKIISYDNAKEALKYLEDCFNSSSEIPDLILLDINMPLMNGWDFLECLKEKAAIKKNKTSVYILSSSLYSKDFDTASKFNLVSGYVVKPLSKQKILEISKGNKYEKSIV